MPTLSKPRVLSLWPVSLVLCRSTTCLGEGECDTLKALIESVGVTAGDSLVEVPKDIRTNDVALVIASEALVEQLSSRLEPHVPIAGHNGAMANALDRKLSQPPVALLSIC